MTFTHLPQLARFIRRTHSTFEARTNSDHGDLATLVEINRLPQGGWHYTERIAV